ncbi:hypothetical protein ABH926_008440 [Catenulispora sp. GP43]|uniref:hypothetical protein n=1 Tax=Catenulispora sp. GP43 TaxID=3156263 RepID=UPI003513642F
MKRAGMFVTIAVAAVTVGTTAGCSASGGTSTAAAPSIPPSTPPAVPVAGLTRGLSLPLEAYEETLPVYTEILKAKFSIESTCMRGYGFIYQPATTTDTISYDASNMARRYGLSDPTQAAQYGYAIPAFTNTPPPDPAMSQQEYLVLTGAANPATPPTADPGTYQGRPIPAGGCAGEADQQLTDPANDMLVNKLDQQSLDASAALPAVKTAIGMWSDCMRQSGYQAPDPLKASLITQQLGATAGDAVDRRIAVADVSCKSRTNLIGIWFGAESALQKQYIGADAAQLRQESAKLAAVRDKAEAVLAAGGGGGGGVSKG